MIPYLPAGVAGDARNDQAVARRTPCARGTIFKYFTPGTRFLCEFNYNAVFGRLVTVRLLPGHRRREAYLAPMKLLPLKLWTASSASRALSNSTKPKPADGWSFSLENCVKLPSSSTCHDAAVDDAAVTFEKLGDILSASVRREP